MNEFCSYHKFQQRRWLGKDPWSWKEAWGLAKSVVGVGRYGVVFGYNFNWLAIMEGGIECGEDRLEGEVGGRRSDGNGNDVGYCWPKRLQFDDDHARLISWNAIFKLRTWSDFGQW